MFTIMFISLIRIFYRINSVCFIPFYVQRSLIISLFAQPFSYQVSPEKLGVRKQVMANDYQSIK